MATGERAEQVRRDAEGGSAEAQFALGVWHRQGLEGLQRDDVKAAMCVWKAADLGLAAAETSIARCYFDGEGVEQNFGLAMEWGRKAADQGDAAAQFLVGSWFARGAGVKKDLPRGKRYLELSAAAGYKAAVDFLKELRKCVACGKLDVLHMICSRCRNRRYCDPTCQLRHWNSPVDPHKLHCVKLARVGGGGGGFIGAREPRRRLQPVRGGYDGGGGSGGGGRGSGGGEGEAYVSGRNSCGGGSGGGNSRVGTSERDGGDGGGAGGKQEGEEEKSKFGGKGEGRGDGGGGRGGSVGGCSRGRGGAAGGCLGRHAGRGGGGW